MSNIDFVVMWVDGSDEDWIREKLACKNHAQAPHETVVDAAKNYRDWDILQYWFRGVEKFAPWVRKIHFVTWGHLPSWLNTECPKLHIVNHKDFMPEGTLPTFNSRALEMNLFRIKGLSERFVYFNDDQFLIRPTKASDFFKGGKPRDCAILSAIHPWRGGTAGVQVNDMEIINDYFGDFKAFTDHKSKWMTGVYGKQLLRTIALAPFKHMVGIYEPHLPVSQLKETYRTIWEKEEEILMKTSCDKFKKKDHVNQWLIRYWQIAEGNFVPRSPEFGCFYDLSWHLPLACKAIKNQSKAMVCLNDSAEIDDISAAREQLVEAFDCILGEKSMFEK